MLIGLVGAPSAGKSSFFSSATLIDVGIANYAFTTIEPNHGLGFVRVECVEKELNTKCNPRTGFCEKGVRYVPVELMDVAGLVPNAHKGEGKGNEFLSDLSRADVLIHVVDVSGTTNEKGEITVGHDPRNTIRFLEDEIEQWFIGILNKNWDKLSRPHITTKNELLELLVQTLSGIGVKLNQVDYSLTKLSLIEKKLGDWTIEEKEQFARLLRKISKPIIVAANKIDLEKGKENLELLKKEFPDKTIVGCSAQSELALKKAAKQKLIEYFPGEDDFKLIGNLQEKQTEALEFIKKNVLKKFGGTGVQTILETAVFDVLKYIAIFPGGVKKLGDSEGRILPDVFLLKENSTALDFAFKIHSDLGNNFIRAIDVKTKKMIGKEHILKHRDVVEIIANA